MIDPDLYYLIWQQEHGELMRKTARRREARETMRPPDGKPGRSLSAQLISTYREGLSLFAFLFIGSRRSAAAPAANEEARTTYQLNES